MWDYIIIGAGSSGCVMAERLSRNPRHKVLLLEAGGQNDALMVTMPKGIGKLASNPRYSWIFPVGQRRLPGLPSTESWVRGKGLGGSSAINGMIWIRGHKEDYESWARNGCTGWGHTEMAEAFRAIEDHELGPGGGRGVGGPVHISCGTYRYPLSEALIEAGQAVGLPRKEDLNAGDQEGIGYYAHNIRNGRRQSAAVAFLDPARGRPNLHVRTGVKVDRILFTDRRASAVLTFIDGRRETFQVAGEVILSAGVMGSPVILQRSGVGPGALLGKLGVEMVADRGGVGRHVLEHLGFSMPHHLTGDPGNNREFRKLGLLKNVLRYLTFHSGPMATGPYEVGGFMRSRPEVARPDIQLFGSAFTFKRQTNANYPVQLSAVEEEPGFTLYLQLLNLKSEGSLGITGSAIDAPLNIEPNWLSHEDDRTTAVAAIRAVRNLLRQAPIARYLRTELVPGPEAQSDEQILDKVIRLSRCGTHAVGACRMGNRDEDVLDLDLKVRGVTGVRVVDCSSMPGLISGNTNAPAMAFAWNAAKRMGVK